MDRYETVEWNPWPTIGNGTLGDLRKLVSEVADWPDDAHLSWKGAEIRRPLPLRTTD